MHGRKKTAANVEHTRAATCTVDGSRHLKTTRINTTCQTPTTPNGPADSTNRTEATTAQQAPTPSQIAQIYLGEIAGLITTTNKLPPNFGLRKFLFLRLLPV